MRETSRASRRNQIIVHAVVLAVACIFSYQAITFLLAHGWTISRDDKSLGGMWAVIATIFVFRYSYKDSAKAAFSRTTATFLSFLLCFCYLLIFPFTPHGMAVLIGLGTVLLSLVGRDEDIVTAGITTTVIMVVANLSPVDAWKEPILRLIDTLVGLVVGMVFAWIAATVIGPVPGQSSKDA